MHEGFRNSKCRVVKSLRLVWLAGAVAGSVPIFSLHAQTSPAANAVLVADGHPTSYRTEALPRRARAYYQLYWGVDSFSAKTVESGELIRFSYRVLDGKKAGALNDKQNEPLLIAPGARVKLVIPSLEKVGQLRQTSTPQPGKIYWMAFSNPGRLVRRGDRVNVVIGEFHINGLVVE